MCRWSLILLLVIVVSIVVVVSFQVFQSRGGGGSSQGWIGMSSSFEVSLESKVLVMVKEGEIWVFFVAGDGVCCAVRWLGHEWA